MKCWPIIGIILRWLDLCENDQCNTEEILVSRSLRYFKSETTPRLPQMDYDSFRQARSTKFGYDERALDFVFANSALCADIIRCTKPAEADKLIAHYKTPGNIENKSKELRSIMDDYFAASSAAIETYSTTCARDLSGVENLRNAPKIVESETGDEPFDSDTYFKLLDSRLTRRQLELARRKVKDERDFRKRALNAYITAHPDEWNVLFRYCAHTSGGTHANGLEMELFSAALGPEKYSQVLAARTAPYADFEKLLIRLRNEIPALSEALMIRADCIAVLYYRPADPK